MPGQQSGNFGQVLNSSYFVIDGLIEAARTELSSIISKESRSTNPFPSTGIVLMVNPSRSSDALAAAKTHLCSIALT